MCGIAGIISSNSETVQSNLINCMTDSIKHRGPDGEGVWRDVNNKVVLGHRRLSIIDLSKSGAQPMSYLEGRYQITYNGEIYNYLELRADLVKEGYKFESNSDTEVLLALYDKFKEKLLSYLDGMFAFAIVDNKEQTVFCARDRFGEKPFFYHYIPGQLFVFASEMKALWKSGVPKMHNSKMLFNFLSYGFVENASNKSETFYSNISKLENANYLKVNLNDLSIHKKQYWFLNSINRNNDISLNDSIEIFKSLMIDSVNKRLRSDVSVGSSLSGGLDSSAIVSIISKLINNNKQKTFSAIFPGFKLDEYEFIKQVVQNTDAEAHYTTPGPNLIVDKFDEIAYYQEEPFSSASICVQYDVMSLARKNNTTVLLDGQGADELLGGYHYYYKSFFRELRKKSNKSYKDQYSQYLLLHSTNNINKAISFSPIKDTILSNPRLLQLLYSGKALFDAYSSSILSKDFFHHNFSYSEIQNNTFLYSSSELNQSLEYSMMQKGLSELLRYSDRNAMAHSVEVRLPFLSHHLAEFVFSLPPEYKISNGWTKFILRKSFEDILPKEIAWRKDKIGYEPPQSDWMNSHSVKNKLIATVEHLGQLGVLNNKAIADYKNTKKERGSDLEWRLLTSSILF